MSDGLGAVRRIVEGWDTMTLEDWREVCTADVRYQNMPWDRTVTEGPDAIFEVLSTFKAGFEVSFDVLHLGIDGDRVFSERLEHFTPLAGDGVAFDLPVMGMFELRDGQVSAWRDYFDRRAMKV